jgi:hypothetical protein
MSVLVDKHTRMEVSGGTLPTYVHIWPKMESSNFYANYYCTK